MRKHRSFKQEPEIKEKKSKTGVYMSVALAVIMIGGIAGIFISNPSNPDYTYGKYDFRNTNNLWITKINGVDKSFYFVPDQVLSLNVDNLSIERLKGSQGVIISFNPVENSTSKLQALDIFRFELANALTETNAQRQVGFAINQNVNYSNFHVITCENATIYVPVLSVEFTNETSVSMQNNCIVLKAADEYGLLALMDNIRYKLYGVT